MPAVEQGHMIGFRANLAFPVQHWVVVVHEDLVLQVAKAFIVVWVVFDVLKEIALFQENDSGFYWAFYDYFLGFIFPNEVDPVPEVFVYHVFIVGNYHRLV